MPGVTFVLSSQVYNNKLSTFDKGSHVSQNCQNHVSQEFIQEKLCLWKKHALAWIGPMYTFEAKFLTYITLIHVYTYVYSTV